MCLRMARGGWRVMHHGATSVYHIEQRASRNLLSADAWKHFRSYLYWLSKWGYRPTVEASRGTRLPPAAGNLAAITKG